MAMLAAVCNITPGMDVFQELKRHFAPGKTIQKYLEGTKCANKVCGNKLDRNNCHLTWGQTVG